MPHFKIDSQPIIWACIGDSGANDIDLLNLILTRDFKGILIFYTGNFIKYNSIIKNHLLLGLQRFLLLAAYIRPGINPMLVHRG